MVVTAVVADLATVMTIVPVMAIVAVVTAVVTPLAAVVTAPTMVIGKGRGHRAQGQQRGDRPYYKSIHAHDWPRLVGG